MTKVRRFWAVVAFLGMGAIVSSSLQGQQGKKAAGGGLTPQTKPAEPVVASPVAEAAKSRFDTADVQSYLPLQGDAYVALQVQPKLEPSPARPRDFVIMLSHSATQAGQSWAAGYQIAEGIIESIATDADRVCLWTFSTPEGTKQLTKEFLTPKDAGDKVLLKNALKTYRNKEYPHGNTDLKHALTEAVKSFESNKDRQRIIVFLGDGMSLHNPIDAKARLEIAKMMVDKKIGFFPVPLGATLEPMTLHGLANSTGGTVLRTRITEEKLVDALERYKTAFNGPILYNAKIDLPAEMSGICPANLPPLRSDSPTLVVGRLKKGLKELTHTITGVQAGRKGEVTVTTTQQILPPDLDNFFLVGMIDQWAKAKEYPAVLQANRALALAYEDTRLAYQNMNEEASLALEQGNNGAARKIFEQIRRLSPDDAGAKAGINFIEKLENGTLTREALKEQFKKRTNQANALRNVDGKPQWVKVNILDAQDPEKAPAGAAKKPGDAIGGDNLIKEFRDRQAVEEQKFTTGVEDAIRRARRDLAADPDGNLDNLRTWLNRVKDHPDLGGKTRDALTTRLQTALRDSSKDVALIKIRKNDENARAATVQANLTAEQERKTFVERVESQYRVYKDLMKVARYEERTKVAIMEAMVAIQADARVKGMDVPVSAKAAYDISLMGYPVQQYQSLVRRREEKWLAAMMSVEKSHMPYPDEPRINFPPLAAWKAILEIRKDKYSVTTLPNDAEGIKDANKLYKMLQEPIDTKGLRDPEKNKLKTVLELFNEMKQGNLPIVVDEEAFLDGAAEAPSVSEEDVWLPAGSPKRMPMGTALRLLLSKVGKGEATYVIRRSFIEITTQRRYLADKVLRVYPVGDLVIPISSGQQGMAGMMGAGGGIAGGMMMGGGIMGMQGMGGMMGQMGMGGMMGQMGMGGMPMGGMGMGGMGMGGMPMGGMGMGGMPMGGMGMGGMPMGGMGMMGMGGMPMGGMGMMGMGGMPMGGMGMGGMGGNMVGGSFQGGFNGSLGTMGATQAIGLIDIITRIVDPGNWNKPPTINPLAGMMGFGFPGGAGAVGMFGAFGMAGMNGMIGAGAPPDPTVVPPDPQTANSIDFFPPALALIIRAPSRIHSSIEGGIIGGKSRAKDAGAWLEIERKALARMNDKGDKVKVGGVNDKVNDNEAKIEAEVLAAMKKREENIDPQKVWQEAFAKGGAGSGMVIATADFLFDAGEFKHAAEFLKANLRHGVVVRPWVFEALAVALEASNGSAEEIRQVRLSGIALDPNDAQGFLSAAKAMADRGDYDRSLAFCKQAAILEPNDYHPYEAALTYAETGKDAKSMEWAVDKLVSQDWPVDNVAIQSSARKRLESLATTLTKEQRGGDAANLQSALQRVNQRDLIVRLIWDNASSTNPSELEMKIKEPSGSICNLEQKQSPGGGIMIGYNLTDKEPNSQYVVAQAFDGDYEITISHVYGQILGNRARLEIVQNAGTSKQTRRLEIVRLDEKNNAPIKVTVKNGRRTELATVSPAATLRRTPASALAKNNAFYELRAVANPSYYGAISSPRGGAGTSMPSVADLASRDSKSKQPSTTLVQGSINPAGGVPMTAQVRLSADQRSMDMVIRPFFNSIGGGSSRPAVNFSGIPGGSD